MSFSIRVRLLFGLSTLLLSTAIISYQAWGIATEFRSEFSDLAQNELRASAFLIEAERGMWELRFALPNYLTSTVESRDSIRLNTSKWKKQVEENMAAYRRLKLSEAHWALLTEWGDAYAEYIDLRPRFFALVDSNDLDAAREWRTKRTNPPAARAVAALASLVKLHGESGPAKEQVIIADVTRMQERSLALGLAALAAGILVAVLLSRSITRPVQALVAEVKRIASGDLTRGAQVARSDEIGQLQAEMQRMAEVLRRVLTGVRNGTVQVATGARHVASTSQNLSNGTRSQAVSMDEVKTALDEMRASITRNAESTQRTRQVADAGADQAEAGSKSFHEMVAALTEISARGQVVEEVAFQTNLLAVNASLGAVRAGEHGKEFAVVAAEVRRLAEDAARIAKEIGGVSARSRVVAQRSGQQIAQLVPAISQTRDLVQEVAQASQEQSSSIDQIAQAAVVVDRVTQENASAAEDLAATARDLAGQSEELRRLLGFFTLPSTEGGP